MHLCVNVHAYSMCMSVRGLLEWIKGKLLCSGLLTEVVGSHLCEWRDCTLAFQN